VRGLPGVLVLCVLAAACTDDGRNIRSYEPPPPSCTSTATGDSSVSVRLRDDSVRADPGTVPAGRIAFVVRNAGSREHSFHVTRVTGGRPVGVGSIDAVAEDGVCATSLQLESGTYSLYCDLDDHFDRGMHTTLRVT
jgi:hypothetical protein